MPPHQPGKQRHLTVVGYLQRAEQEGRVRQRAAALPASAQREARAVRAEPISAGSAVVGGCGQHGKTPDPAAPSLRHSRRPGSSVMRPGGASGVKRRRARVACALHEGSARSGQSIPGDGHMLGFCAKCRRAQLYCPRISCRLASASAALRLPLGTRQRGLPPARWSPASRETTAMARGRRPAPRLRQGGKDRLLRASYSAGKTIMVTRGRQRFMASAGGYLHQVERGGPDRVGSVRSREVTWVRPAPTASVIASSRKYSRIGRFGRRCRGGSVQTPGHELQDRDRADAEQVEQRHPAPHQMRGQEGAAMGNDHREQRPAKPNGADSAGIIQAPASGQSHSASSAARTSALPARISRLRLESAAPSGHGEASRHHGKARRSQT